MKNVIITLAMCFLVGSLFGQASFDENYTKSANIGLTINNLGVIGNAFNGSFDLEGYPSCEYPFGSGIEHLFDGGLWVGARINNAQVAVTTGAVDATTGYTTGRSGYEFSAALGSTLIRPIMIPQQFRIKTSSLISRTLRFLSQGQAFRSTATTIR